MTPILTEVFTIHYSEETEDNRTFRSTQESCGGRDWSDSSVNQRDRHTLVLGSQSRVVIKNGDTLPLTLMLGGVPVLVSPGGLFVATLPAGKFEIVLSSERKQKFRVIVAGEA